MTFNEESTPAPALIISEELSELVFNSRKLPEFAAVSYTHHAADEE